MWFFTMPTTRSRSALASFNRRADRVGHLGADVLVLEEAVLAGRALARLAGARLAHVVQQRAQPPDRIAPCLVHDVQRVIEDVVLVKSVLRAADALEQLRDHLAEEAGVAHQQEAARRLRRPQHLQQLVADPFGGHLAEHVQRRLRSRPASADRCRTPAGRPAVPRASAAGRPRESARADRPPRGSALARDRHGRRTDR